MAEGPLNPYTKKMDKKKKKAIMSRGGKGLKELCAKESQPFKPDQIYLCSERQNIEEAQKWIYSRRPTSSRQKQNEAKLHEERSQRAKRLLQVKAKEQAEAEVAARAAREVTIVKQEKSLCGYEYYLLHFPRGRILHELHYREDLDRLYAIRFSHCGKYIVAGFGSGVIQVWDATNGNFLYEIINDLDDTSPVTSIRFVPKFRELFIAASSNGEVFICDIAGTFPQQFHLEPETEINAMDMNYRGDLLATGGKDGLIRVYDSRTLEMTVTYAENPDDDITGGATESHRHSIYALYFYDQMGETLISGGWDNYVKVWDCRDPKGCIRKIFGPHLFGGDSIDSDGYNLITSSWVAQGGLQIWDFRSGNLISTLSPINRERKGEGEFLYAVRYLRGDGRPRTAVIVAGSGLKGVEIVDLAENKSLATFPVISPIWSLHNTDRFLTFGGKQPKITVADYMRPPNPAIN